MGLASFFEDNNEAERSFPPLETDELNNPPRHKRDGTTRTWTPEQRRKLKRVRDRAAELGLLDIIRFLWNEASVLYSSPRVQEDSVSLWEKHPTDRSKSGSPIYLGVFYMGCHLANKELGLANYVYVSLSPQSLHRLTGKSRQDCFDFLVGLEDLLDAPLRDWANLPEWHFLPLEQLEQAPVFLKELNKFIGVEPIVPITNQTSKLPM